MPVAADLDVEGKRVLVRSDLNVPVTDGSVGDDGRIRASVPLLRDLLDRGARPIVVAHLGRPKGEPDPATSLAPVAERLQELLGAPVRMAQDVVGESAAEAVRATEPDRVVLLENVRWAPGETSKDDAARGAFADRLAAFADLYVDDAFGAVHRKHASVYDVAQRLPHAAGPLVAAEVAVLDRLTTDPERPYVVVFATAAGTSGQPHGARRPALAGGWQWLVEDPVPGGSHRQQADQDPGAVGAPAIDEQDDRRDYQSDDAGHHPHARHAARGQVSLTPDRQVGSQHHGK